MMEQFLSQLTTILWITFGEYALVLVAVIADLWSGIRKAKARGELRTSAGFDRTTAKLAKRYNLLFGSTVMDAMQIIGIWYLDAFYACHIPLFPIVTMITALGECAIELKSIYEKADEKEHNQVQAVLRLAKELAAHRNDPEGIAKAVAEYLKAQDKQPD